MFEYFPPMEKDWPVVILSFVVFIQLIRVTLVENRVGRLYRKMSHLNQTEQEKVSVMESIYSKIDNLSDFIRNKVVLKKDKSL